MQILNLKGRYTFELVFNSIINYSKNIPVVISTRVLNGRVMGSYGFVGGGKTTVDAGAVMADDLRAQKARILLMLLLQQGTKDQKSLQQAFDK